VTVTPAASLGPRFLTAISHVINCPAITCAEVIVFVICRSEEMVTGVDVLAVLLADEGSGVSLVTVTVFGIFVFTKDKTVALKRIVTDEVVFIVPIV
jgi:hypothetical protein